MNIYQFFNDNFLFDSHTHINFNGYDLDRKEIIETAIKNNVEYIFDIGTDIQSSKKSLNLSKEYNGKVFSFIGIDPEVLIPGSELFTSIEITDKWIEEQYAELKNLVRHNKEYMKGIGETGMDFYWLKELDKDKASLSRKNQEKLFKIHLELAHESNLPLSIHSRGAERECLNLVKSYENTSGIFHSYTGDYQTAKDILDAGWGLGVNGIVTFKNAYSLREIYQKIIGKVKDDITVDYFYQRGIYFETEAPFLSPEGKRGQRNVPANVKDIYQFLLKFLSNSI